VDAVKRLSFEVKESLIRLKKITQTIDPQLKNLQDAIEDDTFTEEAFRQGKFEMDEH